MNHRNFVGLYEKVNYLAVILLQEMWNLNLNFQIANHIETSCSHVTVQLYVQVYRYKNVATKNEKSCFYFTRIHIDLSQYKKFSLQRHLFLIVIQNNNFIHTTWNEYSSQYLSVNIVFKKIRYNENRFACNILLHFALRLPTFMF